MIGFVVSIIVIIFIFWLLHVFIIDKCVPLKPDCNDFDEHINGRSVVSAPVNSYSIEPTAEDCGSSSANVGRSSRKQLPANDSAITDLFALSVDSVLLGVDDSSSRSGVQHSSYSDNHTSYSSHSYSDSHSSSSSDSSSYDCSSDGCCDGGSCGGGD